MYPLTRATLALTILLPLAAHAQEGHMGHGHSAWHDKFYRGLLRNDTKTSCCNLADCRPTSVRMTSAGYEVKVDGVWTSVPRGSIQNVIAPDAGAHVCAPKQQGQNVGVIYCVVLPPEI